MGSPDLRGQAAALQDEPVFGCGQRVLPAERRRQLLRRRMRQAAPLSFSEPEAKPRLIKLISSSEVSFSSMKQNADGKPREKIESQKKRVTVLVDAVLAASLRELVSLTATRHTMSSVVGKAMQEAARFPGKRYGPFPRTPSEREIRLKGGRPPRLPTVSENRASSKRVPITVYVDDEVINRLKKAVYHSPTRFTMAEVVSTSLQSAVRILERHKYHE
jgi:hypothetical protein